MRKLNFKIGIVIIGYAIILSIISITGLIVLRNTSLADQVTEYTDDNGVYLLSQGEWKEIMEGKKIQINSSRILWKNSFDYYYAAKSFKWIPTAGIVLCLFFLMSSIGLWMILKHLHLKENILLLQSMKEFEHPDTNFTVLDIEIQNEMEKIRNKFINNLNDYKRLNSYVSHEQKNSLSVLRTKMEGRGDMEMVALIDRISGNLDDILTLSDDMDTGTMPVDAVLVCAEVCDSYKGLSVPIFFDFDENVDSMIRAKERWIYRAVSNLVDNAIKYGSDKPIHVGVHNKHKSVIISVKDNGIGISEDRQEQIFENRYRINNFKKDGYGIGLSLVSHICNLCGGFVYVESRKNEGSVFYLSFPEFFEED